MWLFLVVFSGCLPKRSALQKEWPVGYYPTQWRAPVQMGEIVRDNNDTLKGYIKVIMTRDFLPIIPDGRIWADTSVINVKSKDITYMRLYEDTTREHRHFSEYIRKDDRHLWRLVAQKKEAAIYDNFLERAGGWKNKMVLVTPGKTVLLYNWPAFMLHFGNKRPLLKRFIYRRYKVRLPKSDLSTSGDLINYILKKEN
jgi:hypothetical protein